MGNNQKQLLAYVVGEGGMDLIILLDIADDTNYILKQFRFQYMSCILATLGGV